MEVTAAQRQASMLHNIGLRGGCDLIYAVRLLSKQPLPVSKIRKATRYSASTAHHKTLQGGCLICMT